MSEDLAKEQAKNLYLELERAQEEGRELASKLRARIADLERSQAQQSSFDPKQGAAPLLAAHVTDADAHHTVKALQERNQALESENAQVREKLVQADVAAKEMEFSLMALNAKFAEEGPLRAELEHQVLMLRRQPQSELEEEVLRLRKEAEKGGMEAERAREESAELAVKLRKRIAALEESGLEEKVRAFKVNCLVFWCFGVLVCGVWCVVLGVGCWVWVSRVWGQWRDSFVSGDPAGPRDSRPRETSVRDTRSKRD